MCLVSLSAPLEPDSSTRARIPTTAGLSDTVPEFISSADVG